MRSSASSHQDATRTCSEFRNPEDSSTQARHKEILFTDEKLFTVEKVFNKQNSRILATSVKYGSQRRSRRGHPVSVMVWAGITSTGKTVFVPLKMKINAANYLDDILKKVVEPWASSRFGNTNWTYQQEDSAPAHKAKISKTCASSHTNLKSLKEALRKAWDGLDPAYLRATANAFPTRLKACVKAEDG
uniref:DDE_3 domain-containing protein n=1 Tax=Caenorhabditis japonica TaxID=281687 RepID=A0A8R1IJB6_CAEJA